MNWTEHQEPIEPNIPIPPKGNGRPTNFPFRQMKVGDSFLVRCPKVERKRVAYSLTSCRKYASMKTGFKFSLRYVDNGVRIWRTE